MAFTVRFGQFGLMPRAWPVACGLFCAHHHRSTWRGLRRPSCPAPAAWPGCGFSCRHQRHPPLLGGSARHGALQTSHPGFYPCQQKQLKVGISSISQEVSKRASKTFSIIEILKSTNSWTCAYQLQTAIPGDTDSHWHAATMLDIWGLGGWGRWSRKLRSKGL